MTDQPRTLSAILATAEREAYRDALQRHDGSITEAARELGVERKTASRAVERLGLRAWLDAAYPHRDPATVGRRGDTRKRADDNMRGRVVQTFDGGYLVQWNGGAHAERTPQTGPV